jgi:16S rRNA (cytosine967-C5)-methyltransferase
MSEADPKAGLGARRLAWNAVMETLKRAQPLDDVFDELAREEKLESRDEALARAIAIVTFRRFGTIRTALEARIDTDVRDERVSYLLAIGAAQILFLDVPDHAVVDTAVRLSRTDEKLSHARNLINAVLRRVSREKDAILKAVDAFADTPEWLVERWTSQYGEALARKIALAHREPAAVDLSVKSDLEKWASALSALKLPTGSLRLVERTAIRELPGFADGEWWVQDAAAALPARLLHAKPGERVADICAAPGGKTAQLAAAGADVVAIDRSARRLKRVDENLARLKLTAEIRAIDALKLEGEEFSAVLIDAPCSATGTIRRHPDVGWTKDDNDIRKLADLQRRLLDKASTLVKPGGRIVYCTCSLEAEEGEDQAKWFLAQHSDFERIPIQPEEIGGLADAITADGDLRTLPFHLPMSEGRSGLDGFFAARFVRKQ